MGVLYLVRHGQATGNDGSYDALSELGREQARAAGAELARRGVRPDRIVTGELRRQRETADELLAGLGAPVPEPVVDGRWDEYDHVDLLAVREPRHRDPIALATDLGAADRPGRALQELLDAALRDWTASRTGGHAETWSAFAGRVRAALDDVVAAGRAATTVVVTSGGPISAVCAALLGVPAEGWLALNRVMVNASITTVLLGGQGVSLLTYNDHAHVAGDGRRLLTYR
ncbi:histidine phosphatase family protein [Planosporangium sp. 12N6]|uniref:histidine phosphatase family protein n=1 Tax=Planosporangium spinosum TaxID=3402278 RepID=UPI003CEDE5BD